MSEQRNNDRRLVARLLDALQGDDPLTHAQVRALLPALIEAELAGDEIDARSDLAAAQRHLARCDECLGVYEQLLAELDAMAEDAALPPVRLTPPQFFTPVRQTKNALLSMIKGALPRFQLELLLPPLQPVEVMGVGKQETLFLSRLTELPDQPMFAVQLVRTDSGADVLVTLRQASRQTRWQVQLFQGDQVRSAVTDHEGRARFADLPAAGLDTIRLYYSPVAEETA
jgi:hypothetical protein